MSFHTPTSADSSCKSGRVCSPSLPHIASAAQPWPWSPFSHLPPPAPGWRRHHKPTLIALTSLVSLGHVPGAHWHQACFHRCAELWLFSAHAPPAHAQPRWGSAARAPWAVLWWVSPPCLADGAARERLWLLLPSLEAAGAIKVCRQGTRGSAPGEWLSMHGVGEKHRSNSLYTPKGVGLI